MVTSIGRYAEAAGGDSQATSDASVSHQGTSPEELGLTVHQIQTE